MISKIYTGDKNMLLKKTLDDFDISSDEVAYMDDTVEGLSAAKNLGIFAMAVGYEGGFQPIEYLKKVADCVIYNLKDLPSILRMK
jgi:phosphoglycolate phosphatase-like HAD superfamily hydrolase